jgi:ABC-type bacteriocin/lantibiotic exporter with double-glycine peptidase domain
MCRERSVVILLLCLLLFPIGLGYVRTANWSRPRVLHLGWTGVVEQSAANTCGPAVLATLLGWRGSEVSESALASRAKLHTEGVTLAEFERLSAEVGLPGQWLRARDTAGLAGLPAPSVVHLNDSFGHFAIFLGTATDFVLLADPARGRVLVPKSRFLRDWTRKAFVFRRPLTG